MQKVPAEAFLRTILKADNSMSLRFGSDPSTSTISPHHPRLKPPPNYRSRRVQLRLLMLVSLLMGVFVVMGKVGQPEFWEKIGFSSSSSGDSNAATATDTTASAIDTRLLAQHNPEKRPPGMVIAGDDKFSPRPSTTAKDESPETAPPGTKTPTAFERTWKHGWAEVLSNLSDEDRGQLYQLLRTIRDRKTGSAEEKVEWTHTLAKIGEVWREHLDEANRSLEQTPSDERAQWSKLLQQLEARWRDLSSLLNVGVLGDQPPQRLQQHQPLPKKVVAQAEHLQALLDDLHLEAVRDDTVFRYAEKEIWFRLIEKLKNANPRQAAESESASLGEVGYTQLFKQPDFYRGKLVAVQGTPHMAYRVAAPKNEYGVKSYYVFWVRPQGGPNNPLVIYSLGLPPGFPELKGNGERRTKDLGSAVAFTGYFFKRWAYRAHDGVNTAPLLIAGAPRWTPPSSQSTVLALPQPLVILLVVLALAAAATAAAYIVYRHTSVQVAGEENFAGIAKHQKQQVERLDSLDQRPGIEESLRALENSVASPTQTNGEASKGEET